MLASRQVLGNVARSRAFAGSATGIRRLATVSDSPLDRKVSVILLFMLPFYKKQLSNSCKPFGLNF